MDTNLAGVNTRLSKVETKPAKKQPSPRQTPSASRELSFESPTPKQSAKVRSNMAARYNKHPLPQQTSEEESSSSEDPDAETDMDNSPTPAKRTKAHSKKVKSGMLRSANAHVKVKTTWPHEVMYKKENAAAKYLELTLPQFVNGYSKVSITCPLPEMKLRNQVLQTQTNSPGSSSAPPIASSCSR